MKNDAPLGKNRTGIELSPLDKKDMLEIPELTVPSTPGNGAGLAAARSEYILAPDLVGSVPPPASIRGVRTTGVAAVKGLNAVVLMDKLGERLAFERTGTRLYEALMNKCVAGEPLPDGPSLADLQLIHSEELAHFELVQDAIRTLGGDPTAMTPSADLGSVASAGLVQVVTDPRTTTRQSLEAMLIAELVDNDGWALLIELTRTAEQDALAQRFEDARQREEEHLAKLRRWVKGAAIALEKPAAATSRA